MIIICSMYQFIAGITKKVQKNISKHKELLFEVATVLAVIGILIFCGRQRTAENQLEDVTTKNMVEETTSEKVEEYTASLMGKERETVMSAMGNCEEESTTEETTSEKVEEKTEAVTETQTEVVTEVVTESVTEAVTELQTEAYVEPETEAYVEPEPVLVYNEVNINVTEDDYYWLLRIVEAEAGNQDSIGKILVANVIINRIYSLEFPSTIFGVIFENNGRTYQFEPVKNGRIYDMNPTDNTIECVNRALAGEDYSDGALYFTMRTSQGSWFNRNLDLLFVHGDHYFYR